MGIYLLHRSNELDHEKGRPAILLKYRTKTSLIWWGTHKIDKKTKEKPLVIIVNNVKTYFYAKGIEKVASYSLKEPWVDFSHKNKTIYNNC
ncbi:MAG: hypothetical protein PPFGHCPK_01443 (plasmid) [Spiroplasma endosymbiont of Drosophila atripex]|nr:MAG: hypothetical protein PPFGHCPK_01443 [Spiroplasma endosymbiont of Drosophila atripex]